MDKARILIVEDEVIIAMEIENSLISLGYHVTSVVNSSEKAIAKAEEDNPDLILMDIRIKGGKDGIETAEVIRNLFNIPVIFSTAYLDQEKINRAKMTIPFGFILKPIQERELKVTIDMALYVAKVDRERRKAEQSSIESEKQYRELFDSMRDGFALHEMIFDDDGNPVDYRFLKVNPAFERLTGLVGSNIIGKTVLEVIPGIEKFWIVKYGEVVSTGTPTSFTNYSKELDRYFTVNAYRPRENQFACLFEDITEKTKIQSELLNTKEFYQDILEKVEDGIWVTNSEDKMIYFNPAMEKIAGVNSNDVMGVSVTKDFPKETIEHFITFYMKAKETLVPQQYEASIVTPAGRKTTQTGWLVPRVKGGHYDGMICTIQDITVRSRLEKERSAINEHLMATLKAIPDMMFEIDKQGRQYGYHIPSNQTNFALPRESMEKSIEEILPKKAVDTILSAVEEAGKKGNHLGATYKLDLPDQTRWYELSVAAKGKHNNPDGRFIVLAREITDRKLSEEALLEREHQLRQVQKMAKVGHWELNVNTGIIKWSDEAYTIFGQNKKSFIPTIENYNTILHPDDRDHAEEIRIQTSSSKEDVNIEYRIIKPGGITAHILQVASNVFDDGGNLIKVVGTVQDITQYKVSS